MNFKLSFIPKRSDKPRNKGVTMMMDKGLGLRETEHFIEASGHLTDIVKFGFGTAFVTKQLEEKITEWKWIYDKKIIVFSPIDINVDAKVVNYKYLWKYELNQDTLTIFYEPSLCKLKHLSTYINKINSFNSKDKNRNKYKST